MRISAGRRFFIWMQGKQQMLAEENMYRKGACREEEQTQLRNKQKQEIGTELTMIIHKFF